MSNLFWSLHFFLFNVIHFCIFEIDVNFKRKGEIEEMKYRKNFCISSWKHSAGSELGDWNGSQPAHCTFVCTQGKSQCTRANSKPGRSCEKLAIKQFWNQISADNLYILYYNVIELSKNMEFLLKSDEYIFRTIRDFIDNFIIFHLASIESIE